MIATIAFASHISAVGDLIESDGTTATVRDGSRTYTGRLLTAALIGVIVAGPALAGTDSTGPLKRDTQTYNNGRSVSEQRDYEASAYSRKGSAIHSPNYGVNQGRPAGCFNSGC